MSMLKARLYEYEIKRKESETKKIRELHKLAFSKENKFVSNEKSVRAIPTREELEDWLNSLDPKFKLEKSLLEL